MPGFPPHARLAALVRRAAVQARDSGRAVLASVVELVPPVDPLALLASVGREADPAIVAARAAGCMAWTRPSEDLALAAIGAALTIEPAGPDRFADADQAWRAVLRDALVDDGDVAERAAGPLLVGGFAFEPEGPRSALWGEFGSAHLAVPSLLLTVRGGDAWLTCSVLVSPGTPPDAPLDAVLRLRALALEADATPFDTDGDAAPLGELVPVTDLRPSAGWRALVGDAVARIRGGELRKVVLARAVRADLPHGADATALLHHLRTRHRDSFVFGCWRGDRVFVGASPERLVRVAGREVDASSLAGSAPRGETPDEDAALSRALSASAKDRAEHAMVRTALNEALATLCDDVRSSDTPSLLTLPNVHHLHTAVHARLRDGHSLLQLAGALHPTPAVGGTPREAALAFIREREHLDRGWYAAPVGWIGRDGGELAVALRSAVLTERHAILFAGCGIVAGSDPARELAESEVKLRAMRLAVGAAMREPAADAGARPAMAERQR